MLFRKMLTVRGESDGVMEAAETEPPPCPFCWGKKYRRYLHMFVMDVEDPEPGCLCLEGMNE